MATEAVQEPTTFTANFEIVVTGIRTANVDGLTDVIKQVEWTLKGTQDGQTFELPQKTELAPPDAAKFIPLSSITDPTTIVAWIEDSEPRLNSIKAHIQSVLNRMVKESGTVHASLPWLPVPAGPLTPPGAEPTNQPAPT